jgi:hypothetical protein
MVRTMHASFGRVHENKLISSYTIFCWTFVYMPVRGYQLIPMVTARSDAAQPLLSSPHDKRWHVETQLLVKVPSCTSIHGQDATTASLSPQLQFD